eukprot:gnl/TRDRNA2_/TRDRNA2_166821_c4_seq1.p1 gnl/TRDRNA2_/TRDRNA2_166821_c4~~gnl/TRDRNA2_/TRDRNA2_166821_c4_seq1.p1  ORF type:complete len:634 (-),score=111.08 gnl/TRDRNA2_/TRDRNA2_166821_c4_seq1:143-2044(-)
MEALKVVIRERLRGSPVVSKLLEERPDLRDNPAALLQYLEEKGLVEDLFASLESDLQKGAARLPVATTIPTAASQPSQFGSFNPSGAAALQLCLRLHSGRAFLDFLDQRDAAGRELRWHVSFGGQRLRTRPVPAAVDPVFDETLFLELPCGASRVTLLEHHVQVHLVLVSLSPDTPEDPPWGTGVCNVLCSHYLEWRHCLASLGPLKVTEELRGVGRKHQLPFGALHAELELLPTGPTAALIPELSVSAQLRGEEQQRAEVMRRAFETLDRWWAEYHQLYARRHVRIFAQTENLLFLPVTHFVAPLEAGRALDSPLQALRWTSLIAEAPPERPSSEGGAEPCWHTLPALWARGRATPEEKAILLCSLLLGYSMDAWCCMGTDVNGQPHMWVLVRTHGDGSAPIDVSCWDPRGPVQIRMDDPRYLASYTSIDAVFNDRRLLICHAGAAARVSADFGDPRCWLSVPLDEEVLETLRMYPAKMRAPFADIKPRVWGLPVEAEKIEMAVESRLASAVRARREAVGLSTTFDEHLSQLLHVALAGSELERATGGPGYGHIFEGLVKRVCSADQTFRAVPVQFNHLQVSRFWAAMSDRQAVREVLGSPASATFGLRARAVSYPEGAVAVWVLLAVRSCN